MKKTQELFYDQKIHNIYFLTTRKWKQNLAKADILFSFPPKSPGCIGGMDYAPNVKWVQTTSSGVGRLVKDLDLQNSDLLVTTARGVHVNSLA